MIYYFCIVFYACVRDKKNKINKNKNSAEPQEELKCTLSESQPTLTPECIGCFGVRGGINITSLNGC